MRIILATYSPTFTGRKVARFIGAGLGGAEEIDLAKPEITGYEFSEDDLVVFAAPVYAGRLPKPAAERLQAIRGNGALAVAVVVYGNRDYDDALLELKDLCELSGFEVVACAAFIGQHTYSAQFATGRPDDTDAEIARAFGRAIAEKLEAGEPRQPVRVKGTRPYKPLPTSHPALLCSDDCVLCGACAKSCPTGAIPKDEPNTTDSEVCIACGRCIRVCPTQARDFPSDFLKAVAARLAPLCAGYKEPETFL